MPEQSVTPPGLTGLCSGVAGTAQPGKSWDHLREHSYPPGCCPWVSACQRLPCLRGDQKGSQGSWPSLVTERQTQMQQGPSGWGMVCWGEEAIPFMNTFLRRGAFWWLYAKYAKQCEGAPPVHPLLPHPPLPLAGSGMDPWGASASEGRQPLQDSRTGGLHHQHETAA